MNDYRIPKEIKNEFTKEMMFYFLEELVDIFNMSSTPTYYGDIVYIEGTGGWYKIFFLPP